MSYPADVDKGVFEFTFRRSGSRTATHKVADTHPDKLSLQPSDIEGFGDDWVIAEDGRSLRARAKTVFTSAIQADESGMPSNLDLVAEALASRFECVVYIFASVDKTGEL